MVNPYPVPSMYFTVSKFGKTFVNNHHQRSHTLSTFKLKLICVNLTGYIIDMIVVHSIDTYSVTFRDILENMFWSYKNVNNVNRYL